MFKFLKDMIFPKISPKKQYIKKTSYKEVDYIKLSSALASCKQKK